MCRRIRRHNHHVHSDSKKLRSFLASLFTAGDVFRCAEQIIKGEIAWQKESAHSAKKKSKKMLQFVVNVD